MPYFDTNVQMMDAGMVLIDSNESFGEMLGTVKATLSGYGKLYIVNDTNGGKFTNGVALSDLPESTAYCDLFIDRSTIFRKRYLSCTVEWAGEGKYALKLKEGNKNAPLRDLVTLLMSGYGFIYVLMGRNMLFRLAGLVLILIGLYLWSKPSVSAQKTAKEILMAFQK